MEIQHVLTFLKVAELKNFTKTAEDLNFSQSTISFHIQSLEKELGIKLFHRTSRKLTLTTEGQGILPVCRKLRDDYYNLLDASAFAETDHTPLHIGTVGSFLVYRLSAVIKMFKDQYPGIDIQLSGSHSSEFADLIKDSSIDLGFFVKPGFEDDSIELIHLGREPMYLIFPNTYAFKDYSTLSKELTACYSETGCSYKEIFMQFHTNHLIKPTSTLESWSVEMIRKCVTSGIGYSILPKMCVEDDLATGAYQAIQLPDDAYFIDLNLGYRKDRILPAHLKHLVELVRENICPS